MDYVETVLRRQHALWTALFNGPAEEREKLKARALPFADDRENTERTEWTGKPAYRRMLGGGADDGLTAKGSEETREGSVAAGCALAAALEVRSRGIRETLSAEEELTEREFSAGEAPSGRRVASRAAQKGTERRLPERREEGGGPEDNGLRAFSLTLERDTRRFDDGFALY